MLRKHPQEMAEIFNHFVAGRTQAAKQTAARIGFTEQAFQRKKGGMLWWFMIGVAAGIIIVAAATQK
jgi:hypothetical protein